MSIRRKILIYFFIAIVFLTGIAFLSVYILFSQYREEEFQQRQKERITTTLKFLTEIRDIDEDLLQSMDLITIHHLYDEKLLIFDKDKQLVYSSVDDTPIPYSIQLLGSLSQKKPWLEQKDGLYDVVGVYVEHKGKSFYGISKAYDSFGYKKLRFLRYVLLFTFLVITVVIGLVSYFLAARITSTIAEVARQINKFDLPNNPTPIVIEEQNDEISLLVQRFNELMKKLSEAFSFQKHAIHHISHELKTPLAILVSNFERIEKETDKENILNLVKHQKEATKNLSEIINALLEIAKAESGNYLTQTPTRIDEIIFDLVEELNLLHPDFSFFIEYSQTTDDDDLLTLPAHPHLIRAALMNLLANCIRYSNNMSAKVLLKPTTHQLEVMFISTGALITEVEQQYLFQHFFRGENSRDKPGFGLGLVLIDRIVRLHHGSIAYSNDGESVNIFTITLPLKRF